MNLLFLTLIGIENLSDQGIYSDLIRKFRDEGHRVYIVSPYERRFRRPTKLTKQEGIELLKIKTLNIQKTNIIEKGVGTLLIEYQFLIGIKKYFPSIKFDIVLYSTPPITYSKIIKCIKKRDGAKSYLLLKDIFPQNAVDIGLIKENSLLHRFFRREEKKLYLISDYIGCMSPANVSYILSRNQEINSDIVEVNPNSLEPINSELSYGSIQSLRKYHNIPEKSIVFLFGGNLGKPQGIDFLLEVLSDQMKNAEIFIIIIGSGTEFFRIESWIEKFNPKNIKLLKSLEQKEYNKFIQCCDVGMIFLDKRFTIPNFPSRLLSYLQIKKPVLLATDKNTDIGEISSKNGFGLWSESGDLNTIRDNIKIFIENHKLREEMGINGYKYFLENYTINKSYSTIMKHFKDV